MKVDAEIGIVGAGPVGLATSILARLQGYSVIVWDPRADGAIDKACGEGLMPSAVSVFEGLGVELPQGYPFVGVAYSDGEDASLRAVGDFPSAGRGVRRTELHRALEERARTLGVEIVAHRVESIQQTAEDVSVDRWRVEWLVGADGLHSTTRDLVGLEAPGRSSRYGIRRHYATAPWSDRVEVYWSDVGEAYVTPVSPNEIGVAILFEPPGRFDSLLESFPVLADRLEDCQATTDDRGAGPFGKRSKTVRSGRVFLVGDAAGYVDALTGEGIAIGVASAAQLLRCLGEGRPELYARRMRRVTRPWRWSTRALLALTRRRIVHRPLIRVLRRLPWLFDFALAILGEENESIGVSEGLSVLKNKTVVASDPL